MGPIANNTTPYVVIRGTFTEEILARCLCWDDAVVIAERHEGAYIHNGENGTNNWRREHTVVEYNEQGGVT